MSELVKCTALCRDFGPVKALDNVDLTLEPGGSWDCWGPTAPERPP